MSPVQGEASGWREGSFLVSPGKLAVGTALTRCRYIGREDQARHALPGEELEFAERRGEISKSMDLGLKQKWAP